MEDNTKRLAKTTRIATGLTAAAVATDERIGDELQVTRVDTRASTAVIVTDYLTNQTSQSTPEQIRSQMQARAAAILAEGVVLSSFKHKGLAGIEREEPVRRFLRDHLPGRFHVGQGSIASAETILPNQHDIIVADRDACFMPERISNRTRV